jgi:hypothetical protein
MAFVLAQQTVIYVRITLILARVIVCYERITVSIEKQLASHRFPLAKRALLAQKKGSRIEGVFADLRAAIVEVSA